ncbi:MAG: hypothetical protein V1817_00110 [Candidatus Micrarchaeota archaeon]
MVAVAEVIKKMQADGSTREQIIDSLTELGFPNAEELYDKNAAGAAGAANAKTSAPPAPPKSFGLAEAAEKEESEENEREEETGPQEKPLFDKTKEKETEEESAAATDEQENPRALSITQVGDDGLEKTVSIEDMLSKETQTSAGGAANAGGVNAATRFETASLRAKLDETNALLKALSDVNKKILETDREVLMRLKAKETKTTQTT